MSRERTCFLWGPRKSGKSYFIEHQFLRPNDRLIDLLQTDVHAEYLARPSLLRERFDGALTVIDEIQKAPLLLDEIQWLMEHKRAVFLLTGSSARKLRRGHANLLGGRAWRFEMGPLCHPEIGSVDLESLFVSGLLPPHFLSPEPSMDLRAYVADYLSEEVAGEALTKNIPAFSEFLRVAALTSSELLNYTNVASETGVSAKVVRSYFEILEDTMLGFRLRPWTRAKNRRMIRTEKFYLFDVGVANFLARRIPAVGTPEFGKSFEHYILMELQNYRRYCLPDLDLSYWRTSTGLEVDFIVGDMEIAIEVKGSRRVHGGDLSALQALPKENRVKKRLVVALERERRVVDGIEIVPYRQFLDRLWGGELIR